ncbi:hypothetical protein AAFC00_005661 [Neodothiora populina]|uniref:Glycosyltransferase family 28 N-terminal domain-containing protein n=1 Tax=Neodothiora populina TaxID=2781224 RepID=A0ABR3P5P3_9PEZI
MDYVPARHNRHRDKIHNSDIKVRDDGRFDVSFYRNNYHSSENQCNSKCEARHKPWLPRTRSGNKDFMPFGASEATSHMNVAIMITGSRGDVQPFIALGKQLQRSPYSHRVRICTHADFKELIEENGLEFYSIGGDPSELMAYAVKNPGIIPSLESIKAGDIGSRKADIAEMLEGAWNACTQAGNGINEDATANDASSISSTPFVADAIISNPPTYGAIHIAEKLAIPCHMFFTMPWSPTRAFSHPLANIDVKKSNNVGIANYMSFHRMEFLTWEGLSDNVNYFREKTLGLDPISPIWGHQLFPRLQVPFTYCWSEALIPKPADWGLHISISGFFFLSKASTFNPDKALQAFLDDGPPPIYIGFGSIVISDPEKLTKIIFEAVEKTGVRALLSRGWSKLGNDNPPKNIFLLDNVPHDWLFPRVSAVVHHGGAGTTAIGIALGKATVVVPFFGDQPFWGNMVYRAGAGPEPVAYKALDAVKLADSIEFALKPETTNRAKELAQKISSEDGPSKAAQLFQNTAQMKNLGCFILRDRVAVWQVRKTNIQLSALTSAVLISHKKLKPDQLKLVRHKRWYVDEGSQDPLVGIIGACSSTVTGLVSDIQHLGTGFSHHSIKKKSSKRPAQQSSLPKDTGTAQLDEQETKDMRRIATNVCAFAGSATVHIAKFPVALMYNLANGFHNMPAQVGDTTVRRRDPITGIASGMKSGGKELVYGMYDGISGVVTHPYYGTRDKKGFAKVTGFAQGVGIGAVGLVSKVPAAIIGPLGYSGKGVERQIQRWCTGTDFLSEEELKLMINTTEGMQSTVAKDSAKEDSPSVPSVSAQVKGTNQSKRIMEQRMWQGFMEMRDMCQSNNMEKIEQLILNHWESLQV